MARTERKLLDEGADITRNHLIGDLSGRIVRAAVTPMLDVDCPVTGAREQGHHFRPGEVGVIDRAAGGMHQHKRRPCWIAHFLVVHANVVDLRVRHGHPFCNCVQHELQFGILTGDAGSGTI